MHASCDGIDDATYQAMTESEVDVPYKCPKCRARMAKACARVLCVSCVCVCVSLYTVETSIVIVHAVANTDVACAQVGTASAPPAAPPAPAAPLPPPPLPALLHWNDAYGRAVPFFTDEAHRERRACLFCGQEGDQFSRLIPTRLDQWARTRFTQLCGWLCLCLCVCLLCVLYVCMCLFLCVRVCVYACVRSCVRLTGTRCALCGVGA